MWSTFKTDLKWSLAFAAMLFTMGLCLDAHAQTTQPTYVRPSKGAAIKIFTGATTSATSPVFDMTAFESVQLELVTIGCSDLETIEVQGSSSASGSFQTLTSANALYLGLLTTSIIYNVSNLTAYIKIKLTSGIVPCSVNLTMTPIPFNRTPEVTGPSPNQATVSNSVLRPVIIGGVLDGTVGGSTVVEVAKTDGSGHFIVAPTTTAPILPVAAVVVTAASPAAGTLIYTTSTLVSIVTVQNAGTVPLVCAVGTNASAVSSTRYNFALAAGLAANDGKGGSLKIERLASATPIYCLGIGGAGSAAIFPQ